MTTQSHARSQESFGFGRSGVPVSEWLGSLARRMWPVKAAHQLAARAGVSHRTVELWFSRGSTPSGDALAELLRSDIGLEVLEGLMDGAEPAWWPSFRSAVELDRLAHAQAEQQQRIEALRAALRQ